jgi:putative nucleotidyltransferase with HDIG domain
MSDRKENAARLPGSHGRIRTLVTRLTHPVLTGLGVAGFVALASMLLTRGLDHGAQRITEADVGQAAKMEVRATQPFYVPDEATTSRLRDEAARAVPNVYVYDPSVVEGHVAIIREAFALMREGFDRYDREVQTAAVQAKAQGPAPSEAVARAVAPTAPVKGIPLDGPESAAGRPLPPAVRRPIAERLRRFLAERRPEFLKLLPLTPAELDSLAKMRFSRAAETMAVRVLSAALDNAVVRDKVKFLIDISGGALLRREGTSKTTALEKVVNAAEVLDLVGARAKISEAAGDLLTDLPQSARDAIAGCARRLVVENLTFDPQATAQSRQRARDAVPAQVRYYPRGSTLLRQGDVITSDHLRLLEAMAPSTSGPDATRTFFGNAFFVSLLAMLAYVATRLRVVRRKPRTRDYFFVGLVLLVTLFLARSSIEISEILHERWTVIPLSVFLLAIPLSLGTMLVRLVLSPEIAILFAFESTLLAGLLGGASVQFAAYAFVGSLTAAVSTGRVRQRVHLLRVGLQVGLAQLGAVFCLTLASGQGAFPLGEASTAPAQGLFDLAFLYDLAAGLVSGVLAGLLAAALIPVVEMVFGYTTDLKYLELANLESPLLKELFMRAPGTYHHSVVAGSLAEAAAEAIGANPSLARVGAYYHDVGKGKCPHYFAENLRGENPHDKLSPHMSALILKTHVKDGTEILRDSKLPQPIIDICEQHLGTTLIEYFFVKAGKRAAAEGTGEPAEEDFRYPGPKPQFRESALVFLADSVEAAARAIPEPTQPRLDEMVRRITRNKFMDGQLDECDLTLRDLDAIAKAMTRILVAIHHTRPQYPSQVEAEARAAEAPPANPAEPISLAEIRRSRTQ